MDQRLLDLLNSIRLQVKARQALLAAECTDWPAMSR
jgi:hypothetical protein